MSDPETLIQSQQVTITGTEDQIGCMLKMLEMQAKWGLVTVTLTPPSVPDATVGVTQDSQQKSRHELAEKEWRNGWQYQHCSCGVVLGPFHNPDYADDAFVLHQAGQDRLIGGHEQSQQKSRQDGE